MDSHIPFDHNISAPSYFELSWSILSSIGLFIALLSIWTMLMTRPNPLTYIPIIVSVCCAIANGLCYFAFYTDYAAPNRAAASVFADICWLIQEIGLSFYSYQILNYTLHGTTRLIFRCIFWFLVIAVASVRVAILISRAMEVLQGGINLLSAGPYQSRIDHLHVGYFTGIALVETWNSFFLIRLLHKAYQVSPGISPARLVFKYLLHSTEVRVASLCFIGITRAITYSWQEASQTATTTASQVDRFVYTMECLFPIVMLFDILASKSLNDAQKFVTFNPQIPVEYHHVQTHTNASPSPPLPPHHVAGVSSGNGVI